MPTENTFFKNHPYEIIEEALSKPDHAAVNSVVNKIRALEVADQEDLVLVGSMGWGLQTGLPIEAVLSYSRDVDISGYTSEESLFDSNGITVMGWTRRIRTIQVSHQEKKFNLMAAHYMDIVQTTLHFLQDQPIVQIEHFQAYKILKWVAAFVHIYLYSLKNFPDKVEEQSMRAEIKKALVILKEQLPSITFKGNQNTPADMLERQVIGMVETLAGYVG